MDETAATRRSLLHILTLYSTQYNKTVGYCQGIYSYTCIDDPVPTVTCSVFLLERPLPYRVIFLFLTGMAYVGGLLLMNIPEEVCQLHYSNRIGIAINCTKDIRHVNIDFFIGCILGSCVSL